MEPYIRIQCIITPPVADDAIQQPMPNNDIPSTDDKSLESREAIDKEIRSIPYGKRSLICSGSLPRRVDELNVRSQYQTTSSNSRNIAESLIFLSPWMSNFSNFKWEHPFYCATIQ